MQSWLGLCVVVDWFVVFTGCFPLVFGLFSIRIPKLAAELAAVIAAVPAAEKAAELILAECSMLLQSYTVLDTCVVFGWVVVFATCVPLLFGWFSIRIP